MQDNDPLVLNSVTSNLVADSSWFQPVFVDTGLYSLKIFAQGTDLPPISRQLIILQSITSNRILIYDRDIEAYYMNINSFDFTGTSANTCSGFLECRIPFYFENLT